MNLFPRPIFPSPLKPLYKAISTRAPLYSIAFLFDAGTKKLASTLAKLRMHNFFFSSPPSPVMAGHLMIYPTLMSTDSFSSPPVLWEIPSNTFIDESPFSNPSPPFLFLPFEEGTPPSPFLRLTEPTPLNLAICPVHVFFLPVPKRRILIPTNREYGSPLTPASTFFFTNLREPLCCSRWRASTIFFFPFLLS